MNCAQFARTVDFPSVTQTRHPVRNAHPRFALHSPRRWVSLRLMPWDWTRHPARRDRMWPQIWNFAVTEGNTGETAWQQ
jgi:hypothetical protein